MNGHCPGVQTFEHTKIVGWENINFGRPVIVDDFVFIHAKKTITIGNYVHIACFTSITGGESVTLGDFAAISQGCRILTATDDFTDWGFGNSTVSEPFRNVERAPINIGRFCVIGANSVVLPGVTISQGAVVGAGSVISRNLEPWGIYVGHNRKVGERARDSVLANFDKFKLGADLKMPPTIPQHD